MHNIHYPRRSRFDRFATAAEDFLARAPRVRWLWLTLFVILAVNYAVYIGSDARRDCLADIHACRVAVEARR